VPADGARAASPTRSRHWLWPAATHGADPRTTSRRRGPSLPGHWEGDVILGKRAQSAIGTLVERQTRLVMLVNLSAGRLAEHVKDALADTIPCSP
jgi:IS30 family transposase